jgi:hypothetical protein
VNTRNKILPMAMLALMSMSAHAELFAPDGIQVAIKLHCEKGELLAHLVEHIKERVK